MPCSEGPHHQQQQCVAPPAVCLASAQDCGRAQVPLNQRKATQQHGAVCTRRWQASQLGRQRSQQHRLCWGWGRSGRAARERGIRAFAGLEPP